jgi:hypothetical protein
MGSTYLSLHYHLVFSTKNRQPLIASVWRELWRQKPKPPRRDRGAQATEPSTDIPALVAWVVGSTVRHPRFFNVWQNANRIFLGRFLRLKLLRQTAVERRQSLML